MSASLADQLPPSLNLPPHLSAHKYFFVCTLTVAAWDTLVLSPRALKLWKNGGWPPLRWLFEFLRYFMPAEFVVVAVAFFDTKWSQTTCGKFYLFEPICTAILLAAASAVHVIRVHAIYEKNRSVLMGLGSLFAVQVVVTAICCGFYLSVPLLDGQGCIAGPKHNWVGIYWLSATLTYTASFVLALMRTVASTHQPHAKPLSPWKLMLRDGLNLYGAIWLVNMVNMLFWFIVTPSEGSADTIKTIVTSMAAVLTTSMTLRIILNVRGPLVEGGSYAGGSSVHASSSGNNSRSTHVISTSRSQGGIAANTYDLSQANKAAEGRDWNLGVEDGKGAGADDASSDRAVLPDGVKITIDQEIDYDAYPRAK